MNLLRTDALARSDYEGQEGMKRMKPIYSDPILPKAHPDQLQNVDYDPFGLMPDKFPDRPHSFMSSERVAVARANIASKEWAQTSLGMLREKCADEEGGVGGLALRNALAFALTDEDAFRERALEVLVKRAATSDNWSHGEWAACSSNASTSAMAYDLLVGRGQMPESDGIAIQTMLHESSGAFDLCPHYMCGNHNAHNLARCLGYAAGLGDRQWIHNSLYGWDAGGRWRYGMIHQLRHDIFSDGLHWERTIGYHYYTLMAWTNFADLMRNIGVDLWHKELPPLRKEDLHDLHDAYRIKGTKCLKAAFDAPLYQMFTNGDFSLIHDSGLFNIRGIWIWGMLYNFAYEAYGDEKYAWLLNRMEDQCKERERTSLPMPFQTHHADMDFARITTLDVPEGAFSLAGDCAISLDGRHENGCTLFPVYGCAVLRSSAVDEGAPGAYIWFGPHRAGHQSPAALHLDIHAGGVAATEAPRAHGYEDPNYLTWVRSTIAHNTVTVDETPMFPHDGDASGLWEADRWRDRVSDGELLLFQPGDDFHAVRAMNEYVYDGVVLDRTVVVSQECVIDVFRVTSDEEHLYDWAMHAVGVIPFDKPMKDIDLGMRRGYQHLADARVVDAPEQISLLKWKYRGVERQVDIFAQDCSLIVARDFVVHDEKELGEITDIPERTCVIMRTRARESLFVAYWSFGKTDAQLDGVEGSASEDVVIKSIVGGKAMRWKFPVATESSVMCL